MPLLYFTQKSIFTCHFEKFSQCRMFTVTSSDEREIILLNDFLLVPTKEKIKLIEEALKITNK